MAFGDYLQLQRENQGFAADLALDGSAVAATHVKTVRANHTIFVQRIVLSITTHANGKVFTVQDDNTSPKIIANRVDLTAAAGVPDCIVWDFGPIGIALTAGKNLDYVAGTGGSGLVGVVHIEGYQKLTSTINTGTANTAN